MTSSLSVLSRKNNTTTPLNNGETWTGEAEDDRVSGFPDVGVSCFSDTSGTLYMDFRNPSSPDQGAATDWRTFPPNGFPITANIHKFHTAVKLGRDVRVRFVNDSGSNQSTLQVFTYFGQFRQANAPMNLSIAADADAIVTRDAFDGYAIGTGLVSGRSVVHKFGRNTAVGTTFVPVAIGGIYRTPQVSAATTLRVKAGNAADAADGNGARSIYLQGLDATGALIEETIATNGNSAGTASSQSFLRLFRAYVASSGTYASATAGSHQAAIVIENGSGGTNWATIDAANFPKGQTEIGVYTVPLGKTAHIPSLKIFVDSSKTATIIFFQRQNILETAVPYSAMREVAAYVGVKDGFIVKPYAPFGPFPALTDIGFMARVTSTTADVSVNFELILTDD